MDTKCKGSVESEVKSDTTEEVENNVNEEEVEEGTETEDGSECEDKAEGQGRSEDTARFEMKAVLVSEGKPAGSGEPRQEEKDNLSSLVDSKLEPPVFDKNNKNNKTNLQESEVNVENGKKKGKEDKPPTKVVVRRLPPSMNKESFLEQVAPLPQVDYMYFVPANPAMGIYAFSRAYLNFIDQEDLFIFTRTFDNYVFLDSKGQEYPAVVEFAPFQRVPKQRPGGKKRDPLSGTLEADPTYLAFRDALLAEEIESSKPGANTVKQHYFETENVSNTQEISTTPLLEYLKAKRAEKARAKEERREEKRRKEAERKQKQKKRHDDSPDVKVLQPSVKDKKEIVKEKEVKDGGKIMKRKEREDKEKPMKEKPTIENRKSTRRIPLESQKTVAIMEPTRLSLEEESRSVSISSAFWTERRKSKEFIKQKPWKDQDGTREFKNRSGKSYQEERQKQAERREEQRKKSLGGNSDGANSGNSEEKAEGGGEQANKGPPVKRMFESRRKSEAEGGYERKGGRIERSGGYIKRTARKDHDYQTTKRNMRDKKGIEERRPRTKVYKNSHETRKELPPARKVPPEEGPEEPAKQNQQQKQWKDNSIRRRNSLGGGKAKPDLEVKKRRNSLGSESPIPRTKKEDNPSTTEVKVENKQENDSQKGIEKKEVKEDLNKEEKETTKKEEREGEKREEKENHREDSEEKESKQEGGQKKTEETAKKDPRMERRIRNKDRPSLEIYRPGMGKFSKQRLEKEKALGSSTEVDSPSHSPSPNPQTQT